MRLGLALSMFCIACDLRSVSSLMEHTSYGVTCTCTRTYLKTLRYTCVSFCPAGLLGLDLAALGIPSEEEFIQRYCQQTGTPDIADWSFYLAFTFFRVAAILQGVYKRSLQSTHTNKTIIIIVLFVLINVLFILIIVLFVNYCLILL